MDNDGDVEKEQLQKDILQINQVLGDEDDEGDDSDTDFENEIDEQNTTTQELQLHELGVNPELCEEDTGFAEPSDECSIQHLLLTNQESQKNLQVLLNRVKEEIARNQEEQEKVSSNPSDNEQKNFDLCVRRLFRSYFENDAGRMPPQCDETKQKKETNMPNPFEGPRIKWKKNQNEKLVDAIKTDGRKKKMQPLLNRLEVLEEKMDRLSIPKELEKVYEERKETKKKLVKMGNLPDSELLGDQFRDADWEFIASVDFDGEHTGDECRLHWQNHLHPTINHNTWEETEMKDLMKVAARHKLRDWAQIAAKLGTGRSALQCLSMYQQMDTTFVNPVFSREDDELIHELVKRFQMGNKHIPFQKVAYFMADKTAHQVTCRWTKTANPDIKFGKWDEEEIEKLSKLVERHGARNWTRLAEEFPGRTQYQIRQRWANFNDPDIKHGHWDYQETITFLKKAQEIGIGKWALIAESLIIPGEKRRSSSALLMRFKQVVESYLGLKTRTNPEEIQNIKAEDLYSGKLLPELIAFIELRQKQQSITLGPSIVSYFPAKRRGRPRLDDDDDDDDDDDNNDNDDDESESQDDIKEQNKPVCLTARQKALLLKKGLPLPESTVERTIDAVARNANKNNGKKRNDDNNDGATKKQPAVKTENFNEAKPCDENNTKEDAISCSTRVVPSHTINRTSVLGPRGLVRWLKKIQLANAARAAEIAAKITDKSKNIKKEQEQVLAHQRATYHDNEKSTFDVQSSMTYTNLKRVAGRKQLTLIDHQLMQAVDPMWLCRNGNQGRPTRHSVKAQERTRQEKLCRADQKAMFGLLLKVFDVDLNYTTSVAQQKVEKSKVANKKGKKNSGKNLSHEETTGTENLPGSSASHKEHQNTADPMPQGLTNGPQVLNTGPPEHIHTLEVTVDSQGVTIGPQVVTAGPQGSTIGSQGVTACPPGVNIGPQGVIVGPQEVIVGPREVNIGPQGVTGCPQGVTGGPQEVTIGPQRLNVGPHRVNVGSHGVTGVPQGVTGVSQGITGFSQGATVGRQGLTVGPQGLIVGPQGLPFGHQGVTFGPHGVNVGPHGVNVGPHGVNVGPHGVDVGPHGVDVGPQVLPVGPQGLTLGPQGVTFGPRGVNVGPHGVTGVPRGASGGQGVRTGPQNVTVSQQVTVGPHGGTSGPLGVPLGIQKLSVNLQRLNVSPRRLIVGPNGVTVIPQEMTICPQGVTAGSRGVNTGPQVVNIGPQIVTAGPQGLTIGPQGVTGGFQGLHIGPQRVTCGHEGVIVGPQVVNAGPQGVNTSSQKVTSSPQGLTTIPQWVATNPQQVAAGPQLSAIQQGVSVSPKGVTTSLHRVTNSPHTMTSSPQESTTGQQGVTTIHHQRTRGTAPVPQEMLIEQVSHEELQSAIPPPTVRQIREAVMGSAVLEGTTYRSPKRWMSVKQQLELRRSIDARSALSKNITVSQNGQEANAAAALNSNNQDNQLGLNQNGRLGLNQNGQLGLNQNGQLGLNQNGRLGLNQNGQLGLNQHGRLGLNQNNQLGLNQNGQLGLNQNGQLGLNQNGQLGLNQNGQLGKNQNGQLGLNQHGQLGLNQIGQLGLNQNGQLGLNQNGQLGLNQNGQLGLNQNGQLGLNQNGQLGLNQNGQLGLNQNGQLGLNQNGQLGLNQNGQLGLNQNGQLGLNQNGQLGLNQNGQLGLNQNNQSGLKSVPRQPHPPSSVVPQLLLLRNNITGQLVMVEGCTQNTAITQPNIAAAAPRMPSPSISGSLPAVQFDIHNQGSLIQPNVRPTMYPPQSIPTAPVPVLQSPVLGQPGASPLVISNPPNPLMLGIQGGTAPSRSFCTLPQQPVPHGGLGNVQAAMQQVQPVMNVVENNQLPEDRGIPKLQVPVSQPANSLLPSALKVTQPAVSTSAVYTESSTFVELPLRDGSKIALTLDQYKSFKAGKLGETSCPLLTPTRKAENKQPDAVPSQSEKMDVQQLNNESGPEQQIEEQSGKKQERENSNFPVSNSAPPGFTSPGRCSKSNKTKSLKRKLHTQDISLLPPNVATLQALTSLLLDRKNLEDQRDLFIAKFEKQVEKQQEDRRGRVCFKGYLESRSTAQVESSQAVKSPSTPQKPDQNDSMLMSQDSDTDASSHRLSSDSSVPSYSSPEAKAPQQSVSSQILEYQMDVLRKSDSYKVLAKRFLSLFLWPGLLSSTRIRGSLSTTSQNSYITDQPFVMPEKKPIDTASAQKKPAKKACSTSKEASVRTQNGKAITVKVENQTEMDGVNNLVGTKETEVNGSQEEIMETASASGCHNNKKRKGVKVQSCGQKRKAEDSMASCHGEEQAINGEGDNDAADIVRCKKRKAAVCGSGDRTL